MNTEKREPDFSHILKNNPSGWILRTDLTEKTGGLIHSRTAANLDSKGEGIKGRIVIGKKKIAYPVEEVVKFLQARARYFSDGDSD